MIERHPVTVAQCLRAFSSYFVHGRATDELFGLEPSEERVLKTWNTEGEGKE